MSTIFKKKPFLLPDEDEPSFRLDDDMSSGVPAAAGTGQPEPTATELLQAPPPPLESPGAQPRWTALDEYSDTVSQRPQLKRPGGWKGALQTVGEVALGHLYGPVASERIMHPKYTRQMDEYGEAVGEAKAQADIEGKFIDRGVNQAKLESAQSLNARRGALADKQGAESERRLQKLDEPKPKPEMVEITEERGKKLDLKPDAEGRYWIPLSQIQILRPSAEANPTEWGMYLNAAGGDPVKALKMKVADELKVRSVRAGRGGSGGGDDGRKIPAATAANIEGEKMAARMDARDWADAEIKRIQKGLKPPAPVNDTEAKGRPRFITAAEAEAWAQKEIERAQRIYEGKVGAATGNYPKSATPPAAQGPPPLPAMEKPAAVKEETRQYMGATYKKDQKTGQWIKQ